MASQTLVICMGGNQFFGAERRIMRLPGLAARLEPGLPAYLLIKQALYRASRTNSYARPIIDELDRRGRLIVLPDRQKPLGGKNLLTLLRLVAGGAHFHLSIGANSLYGLLGKTGARITLEVTSPDRARAIPDLFSDAFFASVSTLACVSSNVANILLAGMKSRGYERFADRVQYYSSPYFEAKEHGSLDKEKLVVCASRFVDRKNVHVFAEAAARAATRLPDWRFEIYGKGELEGRIREIVAGRIAEDNYKIGYVDNLYERLKKSSLFVSLIEPDNYPSQSIMEAMTCENALLLSNTGESGRFIGSGDSLNGRLVSLDPDEIAEALVALCTDPVALRQMGTNSRTMLGVVASERNYLNDILRANAISL